MKNPVFPHRKGTAMSKYILASLVLLCLLTGCDYSRSLEALDKTEPTGDAYQKALVADYHDMAEEKAARYDWPGADYFAGKGLVAARGSEVQPEDPTTRYIPAAEMKELREAREKLIAAINENRSTQPEMTASALTAYDRWVDRVASDRDARSVAEQRSAFNAILAKLSEVHTTTVADAPTTTTPEDSFSSVLYFPFDSDRLGDSAHGALAELTRHVKAAAQAKVTLNGHTDRAGTEEYNMDLSERRAKFVMQQLVKDGIPAPRIHYFAFGETDPAVPTEDGVKEPKNRRVEISVE